MSDGNRCEALPTTDDEPAARHAVDILVVDDDDDVRSSMADILRLAGFSTAEAGDGLAALEFLRHNEARLLVLDIRMPRLDGFGLLDALEDPPPVILMSAFSRAEDPRSATASVFWYLQKPLHPQSLLEAVESAIGHSGS